MGHGELTDFLPQRVGRHEAEIPADLNEDSADWTAAELVCDFLRGREIGEGRVCLVLRLRSGTEGFAGGWCAASVGRPGTVETVGMVRDSGFELRRHFQGARDAREDQVEPCAEALADPADAFGGGVLLQRAKQLLAVVDKFAEKTKQAAAAGGYGGGGLILGWIGVVGWISGVGLGRHGRYGSTMLVWMSSNFSPARIHFSP